MSGSQVGRETILAGPLSPSADYKPAVQESCRRPPAEGLYDPALEKDSCGVGFIANIKGKKSHQIVSDALSILCNLEHRGAVGADSGGPWARSGRVCFKSGAVGQGAPRTALKDFGALV